MNLEDYLPLAEMMKQSFVVHKKDIMARFPKYGDDFLTQFEAKIAEVKALESPYSKLQDQKSVTAEIYADAERISRELNFVSAYLKSAKLDTVGVSKVKSNIKSSNIEGAIHGLRDLIPYLADHAAELMPEGMPAGFPDELRGWTEALHLANALQNAKMDELKELRANNRKVYDELGDFVSALADHGKRVFDRSVVADEFNITKIMGRMNR